jgi:putative PIN family toxin of toxin-antitoxin system
LRVVLDTNILVSALVFPGGSADAALRRVVVGVDQLVISRPLIHELVRVLGQKFDRDREMLARTTVFLVDLATVVTPRRKLSVLADEPDNRVLECAVAGRADRIVTGDRSMLALKRYRDVEILRLREHLERS